LGERAGSTAAAAAAAASASAGEASLGRPPGGAFLRPYEAAAAAAPCKGPCGACPWDPYPSGADPCADVAAGAGGAACERASAECYQRLQMPRGRRIESASVPPAVAVAVSAAAAAVGSALPHPHLPDYQKEGGSPHGVEAHPVV
jgi:hypothetical protein